MANRSNYYPRTLRLQSWEVQNSNISSGKGYLDKSSLEVTPNVSENKSEYSGNT
ncbi:hypothetical protein [Fusobacterium periodonticum]|uniref:hypothetical protein n=1 Tax=Fusobacterium periodonticum TaxID=860 RepID=UPI00195AB728|nr:hypothetical protein [Fusobacterium periodonticum]